MTGGTLRLCHDDWEVELDPANGGQIVRADWRGQPVLAPGETGRPAGEQSAGCFPLVPYSNRIRGGKFRFRRREITLPSPEYVAPHALHGLGWRSVWTAEITSLAEARMIFEHPPGAWPWSYKAEQQVRLAPGRLDITLSVRNLDAEPMPAGIGLHPYFIRPDGFWLKATTAGRWATRPSESGLPHVRETPPLDLSAPGLDHCFYGWSREAEFGGHTGQRLSVTASQALGNLVVYVPAGETYFCAEPVSHVNDALNLGGLQPGEEMEVLGPGETLTGTITLSPSPV